MTSTSLTSGDDTAAHPDLRGPFAVLLEDTLRRIERVERALREISYRYRDRIEDRGYRAFVEALQLAAKGLGQLVAEREREFRADDRYDKRLAAYQALGADATNIEEQLEEYLPDLGLERPDELDVFAVPLTRLAKRLVDNVELLFFPWAYDGYEAQGYDYAELEKVDIRLADNLERAFGANIEFIRLRHPATRERDIFHHAVFAHELAHTAIQKAVPREALDEESWPQDQPPPTFQTIGQASIGEVPTKDSKATDRLLAWFEEIACDIVAMRLVGPAFAVAFADVTSSNRPLEPPAANEHPPPAIRFRFLREELAEFGFEQGDDEIGELLHNYTESYSSESADDEIPGAEAWLEQVVEKFRDHLPYLLRDQEYEPAVLQQDLALVFELADRGVPPSQRIIAVEDGPPGGSMGDEGEWSLPLDWRSILNGTLLWHLTTQGFPTISAEPVDANERREQAERKRERAHHRDYAAALTVGGIELSEFHTRARHLRRQFRDLRLPRDLEERTKR